MLTSYIKINDVMIFPPQIMLFKATLKIQFKQPVIWIHILHDFGLIKSQHISLDYQSNLIYQRLCNEIIDRQSGW